MFDSKVIKLNKPKKSSVAFVLAASDALFISNSTTDFKEIYNEIIRTFLFYLSKKFIQFYIQKSVISFMQSFEASRNYFILITEIVCNINDLANKHSY